MKTYSYSPAQHRLVVDDPDDPCTGPASTHRSHLIDLPGGQCDEDLPEDAGMTGDILAADFVNGVERPCILCNARFSIRLVAQRNKSTERRGFS
jgi:hypothetical protein